MYKRLTKSVNDKGELIPEDADVFKYIKNLKKDHYLSVYKYTEEQKDLFYTEVVNPKTSKLDRRGCSGISDVTTNMLAFDLDTNEFVRDLETVKTQTIKVIDELIKNGIDIDDMEISFSGNKGFGVIVNTKDLLTPDEHKGIASKIAIDALGNKIKETSWDDTLYNASRILRIPFTRHEKSKLFKTILTFDELKDNSIEEIKELASEEYVPTDSLDKINLPKSLLQHKDFKIIHEKKKVDTTLDQMTSIAKLNLRDKPKWLSNWKYALQEGFFPEGVRSHALMILCATYQAQGFNKITTYRMLKGAAELQSHIFESEKFPSEEIWINVVMQVYGDLWNGGTYAEDNFPESLKEYLIDIGVPRGNEEDENPLTTIDEVYDTFEEFAENIEKNTVKSGIDDLDKICRMTTSMLVGVLGAPGAGKTSAILEMLNNHSRSGEASVFFSLDMGKPLIYQKKAQKHLGYTADDLFEIFENKDEEKKLKIRETLSKNYENVQICFKTGASVDDMKKYIQDYQNKSGRKVRFVVVDYLEKIVGKFSDATANSGYNAAKLQELANDLEVCVVLLLQPQKMAGDPSVPLRTYRNIKGASIIEQDCRVVISIFREGYDPETYEEDNFVTFNVLKQTMGALGSVDCKWTGLTGKIEEIDDEGRATLKALRKRKAEKKALESL